MAAQRFRSSPAQIVEAMSALSGCKTFHTQLLLIKCTFVFFFVLLHNGAKISSVCPVCFGMF